MSPKYFNAAAIVSAAHKPPITWVHGGKDQVVGDASLFDLATLGQMGAIPGWPGDSVMPPQPMAGQMRQMLADYANRGGITREVYLEDATHGIPLEIPGRLAEEIVATMDVAH